MKKGHNTFDLCVYHIKHENVISFSSESNMIIHSTLDMMTAIIKYQMSVSLSVQVNQIIFS